MSLREIELQQQLERRDARILTLEVDSLAYSFDGVSIAKDDVLKLKAPENDAMFFNSYLGKVFESGKADTAFLEAKKKEWGEHYFRLTLSLNGVLCSNISIDDDYAEAEETERNQVYSENCDYTFLRYFLKKGAEVSPA